MNTLLMSILVIAATINEAEFATPPASAKPHTWYHLMNGNVTKAGITKDFEALAEAGVGGVQMFDAGCGIPAGGLNFNSPEWYDMFHHAASEARRLGLEICIPNCSGWTSSGGPWNPPSNGMKRVVFTETRVKGPSRFSGTLPRETNDNGFYEDIGVLAFPTPPAELVTFPGVKIAVTNDMFQFSSDQPFTMSGISYQMASKWLWSAELTLKIEAADDGVNYREIERVKHPLARSGKIDESLRYHAFAKPLTTRQLRVTIAAAPKDVTFKAAQPEAKMSLSGLWPKTFVLRHEITLDRTIATPDQLVKGEDVRDITTKMAKDGTLEWEVPAGDWTVLRLGYICNGRKNGPASKYGEGLEVDKFSAAALDYHIEQYVGRLCRTLGPLAGNVTSGFNNILVDSYEVGSQNWTHGFEREFSRRRGYEMTKYLPVFAGHIVGSVEESERFLEDFRRVAADLFAENYAGALAKKCRQYGLICSLEPYGSCPADNLQYGMYADIPMCEFWSQASNPYAGWAGNAKFVSHVAHVWGKPYCGAEAFTAGPGKTSGRWLTLPFNIKVQSDVAFASGVNRLIYHEFAHQPWADDKYLPGMTMGMFGMHFNRTQTWWPFVKPFLRYQARCQYMLQRGTFVADALYFTGEEAPNRGGDTDGGKSESNFSFYLPEGYSSDICPTAAMEMLKVENGEVVVPGGVRYRMLVIPPLETMTPKMARTIAKLQRQGATIVWPSKPVRNLGLAGGKAADEEVRRLVDEIHAAGALVMSPEKALAKLAIKPQISWEKSALPEDVKEVRWIHRRDQDAEWYFVAIPAKAPSEVSITFHTRGKIPEIWDAETGKASPAAVWMIAGSDRTIVKVPFDVCGSKFVVFREPIAGHHLRTVEVKAKPIAEPTTKEPGALAFITADYGAIDNTGKISIVRQLNELAKDGFINVVIDNKLAGSDPALMHSKSLKATYIYRGVTNTVEVREHQRLILPPSRQNNAAPLPLEFETDADGKIKMWAWQPLEAKLQDGFYQMSSLSVKDVPAPATVEGAWEVSFPNGFLPNALAKGAEEKVTFDKLVPWNEHENENIRYFSGRATYRKSIKVPAVPTGSRVVLDLGNVCDIAQVTVNGKTFDALWHPPFRLDITKAIDFTQPTFELAVCVANRWANRLIGDDRQYETDCDWTVWGSGAALKEIPKWVKEGKPSPTGRHTFTTFRHWNKDDTLLPSGLVGPVKLWTVIDVTPNAAKCPKPVAMNVNEAADGAASKTFTITIDADDMKRRDLTVIDTLLGVRDEIRRLRRIAPRAKITVKPMVLCGEAGSERRRRIEAVNAELKYLTGEEVKTGHGNADPPKSLAETPRSIIGRSYAWDGYKGWWFDKVAEHRRQVAASGGKIDVVFLGDSNTDNWDARGGGDFAGIKKEFSILNLGYSGDSTQHLLWRVMNGELDGYEAKACVLMIGTNNLFNPPGGREPENILAGIKAIIATIHAKQPKAKIILHPILPQGYEPTKYSCLTRKEVNPEIAKLADGKNVILCDFTDKFENADGSYRKELYGDELHLNPAGFKVWANALLPILRQL